MKRLVKYVGNSKFSTLKGQNVRGYTLKDSVYSEDYKMTLHKYEHDKTNAHVYHIENSDANNAFASIIRTLPQNDKGCPHILEHIVCCGSQRYPVRDPFFNMLRRSVNSYMNAWTGEDFTCYPFSSANKKDWQNLFQVYSDLSMKALVNELDFRQEGWRYEFNDKGQKELKGIVLNEMKGAYQNAERQLSVALNRNLSGGTPYEYDSGGVPSDIVKLSYEQLKNMHRHYYHPSNMAFYFYGSNSIAESLHYLNQRYLQKYDYVDYKHNQPIIPQLRQKFQTIESSNTQSNNICLAYYLGNIQEISEVDKMCLKIISYILLDTNQAELYKAFIESNIAQTFGFSGLNIGKLSGYSVTLRGVDSNFTHQQFLSKFKEVISHLCQKGLCQKRVAEVVYQYQMSTLIPKANNGLRILETALPLFNLRSDLTILTHPIKILKEAQQKVLDKKQLGILIEKYFLRNQFLTVVKQLKKKDQIQEKAFQALQLEQNVIKKQQTQLQQRQSAIQDSSILPILKIEQIEEIKQKKFSLVFDKQLNHSNVHLKHYHVPIQEDVNFYRVVFKVDNLSEQLLNRIDVWKYAVNRGIGAGKYNQKQLSAILSSISVGFSVGVQSSYDENSMNIVFSATCLKKDRQELFRVIKLILTEPKYQDENMQTIFKGYQNSAIQSLSDSPMKYCLDLCSSGMNRKGYNFDGFKQLLGGLQAIKQGYKTFDYKIFDNIIRKCRNVSIIEHSNQQNSEWIQPFFSGIVQSYHSEEAKPSAFSPKYQSTAVTYQYDVNFCSQQYHGPDFLSQQYAHMSVLLDVLQQQYLHPQIRQKGGAYGARSLIRNNGLITLYSYMDPNPIRTFQVFDESIDRIIKHPEQITQQMLLEAKISQFGSIDKPKAAQNECVSEILQNYTHQQVKEYRQTIKQTTIHDIRKVAQKYLSDKQKSRVLFGNTIPEGFGQRKLQFNQQI